MHRKASSVPSPSVAFDDADLRRNVSFACRSVFWCGITSRRLHFNCHGCERDRLSIRNVSSGWMACRDPRRDSCMDDDADRSAVEAGDPARNCERERKPTTTESSPDRRYSQKICSSRLRQLDQTATEISITHRKRQWGFYLETSEKR